MNERTEASKGESKAQADVSRQASLAALRPDLLALALSGQPVNPDNLSPDDFVLYLLLVGRQELDRPSSKGEA